MSILIILILAIPSYFLSKWVLKKRNLGNDKNRKLIAIIPAIFLSPIIYLGLIYLWIFSVSYYPSNDFDKQEWETNIEERYKMSEDIIESKILIGKTKEEIIELLGKDFYTYNQNHMAYVIGFVPRLFNIDPDVLDIYFKNGKVTKVTQHQT
ncbi:hypothetical protein KO494_09000 [Lacinutrix sp. C3R15]|uniref:hypothetical protein n=1 Tax=Flavobacteriaceae TaxID=49546 RepID=UPI001C09740E|nr:MULTISPECIES: hypothetical protein [Flavobacteriaceae]MBU2939674.1 hypothetical protein [Lacinutrix sp. C3R15]MDO6622989.1 hypothetical protein [Oceanihabitans sp. 1_MG-2023]